jgi:5'-3' exonuclease
MTRRLLLDVSSLGYRAYFAMRDSVRSPDGRNVGILYGYLDMVTRLLVNRRPDEIVHVYDHEWRPVHRTDVYADYKGNRQADPEDLPPQFLLLREVLDLTGLLQAQSEGWEAEDAIGAFCLDARHDDRIEIVSGDRDLIQLVDDPVVKLLFTIRGVSDLLELDEAAVMDKYGVPASRYVDFAILRGDPSDGLPGVRGVGEKTARALILAYPSLDELLADAASTSPRAGPLKGKPALRSRLVEAAGYIEKMRELVPIRSTADLSVWAGERNDEALLALAERNGFKGPARRLLAALDSTNAT